MPPGYSQQVVYVERRGLPVKRFIAGLALLLVLLSNLPGGGPVGVQADAFAGNGTSCSTSRHVLTSFSQQGLNYAAVSFHLSIEGGGTVYGRWEGSSGVIGTSRFWSAGEDGDLEWYVTSFGQSFVSGGTGTVSFVLYKVAGYGGCYSIDQASVATVPIPANGPGGGLITPNPSQLAEDPEATAAPTPPPGYDCNGSTNIDGCDSPPSGWCWIQTGAAYGSVGYVLQECEDEGDPPAGGEGSTLDGAPQPACDPEAADWTYYRMTGPWSHSTGGTATYRWLTDGGGLVASNSSYGSNPGGNGYVNHSAAGGATVTVCAYVHYTAYGGTSTRWQKSPKDINDSGATLTFGSGWIVRANNTGTYGPLAISYNSSFTIDYIDVWSTHEGTLTNGGPPPDGSAAPPEGFPDPSGLPPEPGSGLGGPVDQCEGLDDAPLPMCGGGFDFPTFPPVELCPSPTPDIAACQPTASFEAGGEEGSGQSEDGGLGPQAGSGVGECEGANLTPVESKVGYIAPEPVPTVVPLEERLAGFDIFSLDRVPAYVVGAVGWVGDQVAVVPPSVRNTATGVYNSGIHLVVPGDCIGSIVETRLDELMQEPPFSLYTTIQDQVEAAAGGAGAATIPEFPLMGGETVPMPFDEVEAALSPYRGFLEAGIWLFAALAIMRIVVGSFHVGKGSE